MTWWWKPGWRGGPPSPGEGAQGADEGLQGGGEADKSLQWSDLSREGHETYGRMAWATGAGVCRRPLHRLLAVPLPRERGRGSGEAMPVKTYPPTSGAPHTPAHPLAEARLQTSSWRGEIGGPGVVPVRGEVVGAGSLDTDLCRPGQPLLAGSGFGVDRQRSRSGRRHPSGCCNHR